MRFTIKNHAYKVRNGDEWISVYNDEFNVGRLVGFINNCIENGIPIRFSTNEYQQTIYIDINEGANKEL